MINSIEAQNILAGSGASQDAIEEVMNMFLDAEKRAQHPIFEAQVEESDTSIRMRMMDEKDWRKRAALSAMLISNSLK
jgi:hypothetical protein